MFDHQADSADDLTREFWGAGDSWAPDDRSRRQRAMQVHPTENDPTEYRLDHTPTSMRAFREGIAAFKPKRRWRGDHTGPVERTRQHGQVRSDTPAPAAEAAPATRRPSAEEFAHSRASIADLAAGKYDDFDDYDLIPATPRRNAPAAYVSRRVEIDERPAPTDFDDDLIALTPTTLGGRLGLGDVDPLVVRVGIVLLALVLALPLAFAMRGGADASGPETPGETVPAAEQVSTQTGTGDQPAVAPPVVAPTDASPAASSSDTTGAGAEESAVATEQVPTPEAESAAGSSAEAVTAAAASSTDQRTAQADTDQSNEIVESSSEGDEVAVVEEPAERITPDCSLNYTAGPGDSWYRIADEAGVTPSELVAQNLASLDTVILPGDEICLPAGSAVPSAPTTAAPTTTQAPTTTAAPTTTQAPTTTAAPTTTVAPSRSYSTAEVQAMIRETWPEDQHEKALQVAWRESNYVETADNGWCCVGVFQIYWTVHQSWLDDYGIYTRDDLKDGRKNIAAAYALYERSGGWGPWGG